MENNNVYNPSHYDLEGLNVQAIDVIKSVLTEEEMMGYCKGNVIKYILRERKKNKLEDIKKALMYLNWLAQWYKE